MLLGPDIASIRFSTFDALMDPTLRILSLRMLLFDIKIMKKSSEMIVRIKCF